MDLTESERLLYIELRWMLGGNLDSENEERLQCILSGEISEPGIDLEKVISHREQPPEEPSPPSSPNAKRMRLMEQFGPDSHCPTLLHLSLQYNGFDFWGNKRLLEIAGKNLVGVSDRHGWRPLDIMWSHDIQYWPTLALVIKWTPIDELFRPSPTPGISFFRSKELSKIIALVLAQ